MPCFKPLLAIDYGVNEDGKHHIRFIKPGEYESFEDARSGQGGNLMFIPCNKCVGCAADYARSWQGRIMCEYTSRKEHGDDRACFITLTYADNPPELPKKEDLRDFIKAVRNKYGKGISFFGCGELGELYKRSHYHLILFGMDFEDKEVISKRGVNMVYKSAIASKLWNKGFVSVGSLDIASAGYVSKYCDKKKISRTDDGEFLIMSRGLGKQYFKDHKKEIFESDYLYFEGNKFKMPRTFLRWALNDDDFFLKVCAQDYTDRKRLVAQSFRYDKCRSVSNEIEGLIESRNIMEKKKSQEVLRDVY